MSDLRIEVGLPLPMDRPTDRAAAMRREMTGSRMRVGDSFYVEHNLGAARGMASRIKRQLGRVFRVYPDGDGVRVFRMK